MRHGEHQIAERLRAARPRVEPAPPPFASVAGLIEQAEMQPGRAARRVRWPRRFGALLAVGTLALAGCAWGASQLLSGSSVVPAFVWVKAKPTVGLGTPVPSSLKVLGLRAADPVGGPPWGMRIIRTTRGQACLQAGRVVAGKLGAMGTGYAFHGDGRFHPFAPEVAFGSRCLQPDASGNVYSAQGAFTVSADGLSLAENTFERVHCDLPSQHNWGVRCPRSDLRLLAFGTLGPDAASLSVSFEGRSFEVKPYGPQGAYLLVLPAPAGTNAGGYFGAQAPNPPVMTVRFRDGASCAVPAANDSDMCKPQGIDLAGGPKLTAAQLATQVHVAYAQHVTGQAAFTRTGPHSGATGPATGRGAGIVVTFTARVGTPGLTSAYAAEAHRPVVAGCFGGGALLSQEPSHTIASGQTVRIVIPLQAACHGRYVGRIFYVSIAHSLEGGGEERLINRMSERLMGLPRSLSGDEQEITVGHFDVDISADRSSNQPVERVPAITEGTPTLGR